MPDTLPRLEAGEFERLVRDALASVYDPAALSRHPFTSWLQPQSGQTLTRPQSLRTLLLEAIERLHPSQEDSHHSDPQWRRYLLLRARFVDGASAKDVQDLLGLSERQFRRDQARALELVAAQVWELLLPDQIAPWQQTQAEVAADEPEAGAYKVTASPLDLSDLLQGVSVTLRRRAEAEGTQLEIDLDAQAPRVLADRVVLRQVLLSLLSYALDMRRRGPVRLGVAGAGDAVVTVDFEAGAPEEVVEEPGAKSLEQARYWAEKVGAGLELRSHPSRPDLVRIELALPGRPQPVLLVVDDQETALRMFQRYLAHTGLRVFGVQNGAEAVEAARRLRPRAIMLDIMMPNVDGWEVLQGLQADPSVNAIPVIVCSVWEEPELASSLGAVDFFKPITQKDLLAALGRLNLLET